MNQFVRNRKTIITKRNIWYINFEISTYAFKNMSDFQTVKDKYLLIQQVYYYTNKNIKS